MASTDSVQPCQRELALPHDGRERALVMGGNSARVDATFLATVPSPSPPPTLPLRVLVGNNLREHKTYGLRYRSLLHRSSIPLDVHPIQQAELHAVGLYNQTRGPTEIIEFFVDCDFLDPASTIPITVRSAPSNNLSPTKSLMYCRSGLGIIVLASTGGVSAVPKSSLILALFGTNITTRTPLIGSAVFGLGADVRTAFKLLEGMAKYGSVKLWAMCGNALHGNTYLFTGIYLLSFRTFSWECYTYVLELLDSNTLLLVYDTACLVFDRGKIRKEAIQLAILLQWASLQAAISTCWLAFFSLLLQIELKPWPDWQAHQVRLEELFQFKSTCLVETGMLVT